MYQDGAIEDCFICSKHRQGAAAPGGIIYVDDLVYAGHVFPREGDRDAYLGCLTVEPIRHAPGLGDLTDEEGAAVGRLVTRLARILRTVEGAERVYSFVLGHGVDHLHVLLTPRYPGTPDEYWGFRTIQWPDAPRGDEPEMRAVCDRIRAAL